MAEVERELRPERAQVADRHGSGAHRPRWRKPLILLLAAAIFTAIAYFSRRSLGIELSPQALRAWVLELGPIAPLVMTALIAFRAMLGLPSPLLLIVAGLAFGTLMGTVYGATGLTLSALLTFLAARYAGRESVERHVPRRIAGLLEAAGDRPGALLVAFATGYPIGFITAYHAMAGITPMPVGLFVGAAAIGSTVRAATYCYFGSTLVAGGMKPVLQASAVLFAIFALPLLIPSVRRWVVRVALAR